MKDALAVETAQTVERQALDATDAGRPPTQILYLILTGGNAASPACDATPPVMLGR